MVFELSHDSCVVEHVPIKFLVSAPAVDASTTGLTPAAVKVLRPIVVWCHP